MTTPTNLLTCLHVCTSKTCFLHAFCCSLVHLPIHFRPQAMVDNSPQPPNHSPRKVIARQIVSWLIQTSAVSATTSLSATCQLPVLHHLAGTTLISENAIPHGHGQHRIALPCPRLFTVTPPAALFSFTSLFPTLPHCLKGNLIPSLSLQS